MGTRTAPQLDPALEVGELTAANRGPRGCRLRDLRAGSVPRVAV